MDELTLISHLCGTSASTFGPDSRLLVLVFQCNQIQAQSQFQVKQNWVDTWLPPAGTSQQRPTCPVIIRAVPQLVILPLNRRAEIRSG